jgi:hypothetical protein
MTVATRADWIIGVNRTGATPAVPKIRWKCGSQRGQVEQGLVDVEHLDTGHRDLLALPGPR